MKKGFTLMEVIVVLVIISIISLIAIPIVLNIIDKSKFSANKRSVDNYAHAVELAMMEYKLDNGYYTYDISNLDIKYSGKKVLCDVVNLNENGTVYVNKCKIDGDYVEDDKSSDGYYHRGNLIYDYDLWDIVSYNNIDFYVIKPSAKSDTSLVLLKKDAIQTDEVINEIKSANFYTYAGDTLCQYGGCYGNIYIQYYYGDRCIYGYENSGIISGCNNDYETSAFKEVVDIWKNKFFDLEDLTIDSSGYDARIISLDDLLNMGFLKKVRQGNVTYFSSELLNKSIFNTNSYYFTMNSYPNTLDSIYVVKYVVNNQKTINELETVKVTTNNKSSIYPVVNLKKSAIEE